jgi:hypothetical protein
VVAKGEHAVGARQTKIVVVHVLHKLEAGQTVGDRFTHSDNLEGV